MTFPLTSTVFTDGQLIHESDLYNQVFVPVNSLGGFMYGEAEGAVTDSVTLATVSTLFIVPVAKVTLTLTQQRRVRAVGSARSQSGTTVGAYTTYVHYVAGSTATLTGAVQLGQTGANQLTTPGLGSANAVTVRADHSVLLTANTWTFFVTAARATGGSATDAAALGYCAVYDAGNT